MSRISRRLGVISFALIAVLGLASVIRAASKDERTTAFSLDVPPTQELMIAPGQTECEGPISTLVAFAGIQPYFIPKAAPGAAFDLTVRDSRTRATLATGRLASGYAVEIGPDIRLNAPVSASRRVVVCLRSKGPQPVAIFGGPANPGMTQTIAGKRINLFVQLVFVRAHPRSLLSLIPTVFERAALFHPRWAGPWTFWLLAVALLVAFGLCGVAVAAATRADARGSDGHE